MNKFMMMLQMAKFVIWLVGAVRELVVDAEEQIPESGKGAEKFATVKKAVTVAAQYAGIADQVVKTLDGVIDKEINAAVDTEINGNATAGQ